MYGLMDWLLDLMMDGWINWRMRVGGRWMDGWMNGWTGCWIG